MPARKTPKTQERSLRYDARTCTLTITADGITTAYGLERWVHVARPLHAFRFTKYVAGRAVERYDATFNEDTGEKRCDCKGFLRWGTCKHSDAVAVIVARKLA